MGSKLCQISLTCSNSASCPSGGRDFIPQPQPRAQKAAGGVPALGAACICAARLMHPSWVPARRQVALCTQGLWGWDFGTSGSPGCATSGKPRVCHPKWDSAGLRFDSLSVTFQGEVWEGVIFPSSAFVITLVRLLGLCRLKCLQFGKATFFQEEKLGK